VGAAHVVADELRSQKWNGANERRPLRSFAGDNTTAADIADLHDHGFDAHDYDVLRFYVAVGDAPPLQEQKDSQQRSQDCLDFLLLERLVLGDPSLHDRLEAGQTLFHHDVGEPRFIVGADLLHRE
jgi:hypothetical protein